MMGRKSPLPSGGENPNERGKKCRLVHDVMAELAWMDGLSVLPSGGPVTGAERALVLS